MIMNMKKKAIIVDRDSTLYNIDHRLGYILDNPKEKNWKKFYAGIPKDTLNQWCKDMILGFALQGYEILMLTGIHVEHMRAVKKGLERDEIPIDKLYMRQPKDNRADYKYKRESVEQILKEYDVVMAIDDRPMIINMYRDLGVQVIWVANGYRTDFLYEIVEIEE